MGEADVEANASLDKPSESPTVPSAATVPTGPKGQKSGWGGLHASATAEEQPSGGSPQPPRQYLSVDAGFQGSVGEFGPGNALYWSLANLTRVPIEALFPMMVYNILDPFIMRWVQCEPASSAYDACAAALSSPVHSVAPELCSLPSDSYTLLGTASITAEFHLVCGDSWKAVASTCFFFIGNGIGSIALGYVQDAYGRRSCIAISSMVSAIFCLMSSLANTYLVYAMLMACVGFGSAGTTAGNTLGQEFVGPSRRGLAGTLAQIAWFGSTSIAAIIALLCENWRLQQVIIGVGCLLPLLWVYIMPESPRWLLTQGRVEEAAATLQRIARLNRSKTSQVVLAHDAKRDQRSPRKKEGLVDLLAQKLYRNYFILHMLMWVSGMTLYYGMLIGTEDLYGSVYWNNIYFGFWEVPVMLLTGLALDWFGRKICSIVTFELAGLGMAAVIFVTPALQPALSVLAKVMGAACSSIMWVYSTEQFPTSVRGRCINAFALAARIGTLSFPGLHLLGARFNIPQLMFVVTGGFGMVVGILIFWLPETQNQHMPDHIATDKEHQSQV